MAQIGRSLERTKPAEQTGSYATTEIRVNSKCGRLKEKLSILTVSPEKEHIQDLAAKRRSSGTPNPKPK
jgi:hypothetical protein